MLPIISFAIITSIKQFFRLFADCMLSPYKEFSKKTYVLRFSYCRRACPERAKRTEGHIDFIGNLLDLEDYVVKIPLITRSNRPVVIDNSLLIKQLRDEEFKKAFKKKPSKKKVARLRTN